MRNRLKTVELKIDLCRLDSARYELLEKSAEDIESTRLARAIFAWICADRANCVDRAWRLGHKRSARRRWEKLSRRRRDSRETSVA